MIISVVQIKMPPHLTRKQAVELFKVSARRYIGVPGLIRKHYLINDEGETGGVFLWRSFAQAEAAFADPSWRKLIKDRYGTEPKITYYDAPVTVDNLIGQVQTDDT